MIARPQRLSTTLACAFIGTSTSTLNMPNRNAQIASGAISAERTRMSGKGARSTAKIGPDMRRVIPVPPIRDGRSPATGMAAIAPAPAANNTSESIASGPCPTDGLLWKWAGLTSFTSGTGYRAGLER